jgi:CBS domain containing-hemolysin-like protein
MHKRGAQKQFQILGSNFFYRKLHVAIFPENEYESLLFSITTSQNITRFFLVLCAVLLLYQTALFQNFLIDKPAASNQAYLWIGLSILGYILVSFIFGDYLPRILGTRYPETTVKVCAPLSSPFLTLAFPVTALFLKATRLISRTVYLDHMDEPKTQIKQEIIELVRETTKRS